MDNLLWGLQMTVLGMGLVFALLALLWGLLTLVLRLDNPAPSKAAVAAPPAPPPATAADPPPTAGSEAVDPYPQGPALVAAIMVATLAHRASRRREAAPETRYYWPGSLLYASRWVGAGRTRQNQSWQRGGR
jgi:glutaconyl-CoA/methylmalonyl-CoA decarboxylase subunit delta